MIKVLSKFIAVEVEEAPKTTAAGLIIPEDPRKGADETPVFAKVVAVGSSIEEVSVGDRVLIEKYCGRNVYDDGKRYRVITLENILAVDE